MSNISNQGTTQHRLFLCFIPPKEVRDQAREIHSALGNLSYKLQFTNLEQIHLTIKFLGNRVSARSAEQIISSLKNHSNLLVAPKLQLDSVEFGLQNQSKPKIIQINILQDQELKHITDTVQSIVKDCDLEDVIRRKDLPRMLSHITIARVKKDISKSHVRKIRMVLEDFSFQESFFYPEYLYVIESKLTRKGPVYATYAKIPMQQVNNQ